MREAGSKDARDPRQDLPEARLRVQTGNMGRPPWYVEVLIDGEAVAQIPATRVTHEVTGDGVAHVTVTSIGGPSEVTTRDPHQRP